MTIYTIDTIAGLKEVLEGNKVVLLGCFGAEVGTSDSMEPTLDHLAANPSFENVYVAKLYTDKHRDIAQELGVRDVPTAMVFFKGAKKCEALCDSPAKLGRIGMEAIMIP